MYNPILSKTSTECIFYTLYDNSVTGKRKRWDIRVTNQESLSTINCYYGYTDGKKIETTQTIKTGKNIGKSNQTTHYEQSILQATSKWNRKCDQGYKPESNPELLVECGYDHEQHGNGDYHSGSVSYRCVFRKFGHQFRYRTVSSVVELGNVEFVY